MKNPIGIHLCRIAPLLSVPHSIKECVRVSLCMWLSLKIMQLAHTSTRQNSRIKHIVANRRFCEMVLLVHILTVYFSGTVHTHTVFTECKSSNESRCIRMNYCVISFNVGVCKTILPTYSQPKPKTNEYHCLNAHIIPKISANVGTQSPNRTSIKCN